MDVQFWAATDVGRVREHNEDNFLVDKRLSLFIVADGMGGHAAGEVASAIAVRAIREVVANNRGILDRQSEALDDPHVRHELLKLLEYAVQEACTRIYDMAQQQAERRGMGTTCSLLLIAGQRSFVAHVGDSRIYLLRDGMVHQVTEDHSLINEMIRQGRLQEGVEPSTVPYKNAITRAVGVYDTVEVDTFDFDNRIGDRLLLCSDGLSMYMEDDRLAHFLALQGSIASPSAREELKGIVEELIRYGNSRGGKDNITAVLIAINPSAGDHEGDNSALTLETLRGTPLFHYLNPKELTHVLQVTQRRRIQDGELLIREGESGDELFILVRGECAVERTGQELARLGAGRHFGEMALVDDQPRSASVRCVQAGVALVIRRPDFYELLRQDPNLAVKLLWNFVQSLSGRLRDNIALTPPLAPRGARGLRAPTPDLWTPEPLDIDEVLDPTEDLELLEPDDLEIVSGTAITPEQGVPHIPPRASMLELGPTLNPALTATLPPALGLRSPLAGRRLSPLVDSGPSPLLARTDASDSSQLRMELEFSETEPALPALQRDEASGEFSAIKRHRHRPRSSEDEG